MDQSPEMGFEVIPQVFATIRGGNASGTWAHFKAGILYCMWISSEFALRVVDDWSALVMPAAGSSAPADQRALQELAARVECQHDMLARIQAATHCALARIENGQAETHARLLVLEEASGCATVPQREQIRSLVIQLAELLSHLDGGTRRRHVSRLQQEIFQRSGVAAYEELSGAAAKRVLRWLERERSRAEELARSSAPQMKLGWV